MHLCETRLTLHGVDLDLSFLRRAGSRTPLLCLHGFGSTKEDYADLAFRADFDDRDLIFIDAPGFGASSISDPSALSIPFLVETAIAFCDEIGVAKFHLSGHSMGGLTALLLAHQFPDRVVSFINIEGNVAPEDCFLSRQIVEHPAPSAEAFLEGFIARVSDRPEYAARLYSLGLRSKLRPRSAPPIFRSMVDLSDNTDLMSKFAGLTCPRLFVHGEQNAHLSYLGQLPAYGVEVCEIPHAAHFPMYSNPPVLWSALAAFLDKAEI